jgi:hypothetical protein
MAAVAASTVFRNPNELVVIAVDTDYVPPLMGIRSGATGTLVVVDGAGNTRTILGVLAGETIRCTIQRVVNSGTTIASPTTNLLGLR